MQESNHVEYKVTKHKLLTGITGSKLAPEFQAEINVELRDEWEIIHTIPIRGSTGFTEVVCIWQKEKK
ncbi:MAG: hypothetical protein WC955_12385 [Elusimicrobiota bacterium]